MGDAMIVTDPNDTGSLANPHDFRYYVNRCAGSNDRPVTSPKRKRAVLTRENQDSHRFNGSVDDPMGPDGTDVIITNRVCATAVSEKRRVALS